MSSALLCNTKGGHTPERSEGSPHHLSAHHAFPPTNLSCEKALSRSWLCLRPLKVLEHRENILPSCPNPQVLGGGYNSRHGQNFRKSRSYWRPLSFLISPMLQTHPYSVSPHPFLDIVLI